MKESYRKRTELFTKKTKLEKSETSKDKVVKYFQVTRG